MAGFKKNATTFPLRICKFSISDFLLQFIPLFIIPLEQTVNSYKQRKVHMTHIVIHGLKTSSLYQP